MPNWGQLNEIAEKNSNFKKISKFVISKEFLWHGTMHLIQVSAEMK